MADDIQINPTTTATGQAAPAQGGASGQNLAAKSAMTEQSGVIDLSQLDAGSAVSAGAPAGQGSAATAATGQPQTATPTTQTVTSPAQAAAGVAGATTTGGAFSLEEAAMAASAQAAIAPPEKFTVPELVKQKFPDLIQLIKDTESMNDEERDYWFQILPIMTEDQIKKFRDILLNEKTQLQKLDAEYETELTKLNEKHMIEWKEFESKEKKKALTQAEEAAKAQEQATEEDLLKRLSAF